MRVRPVVAVVLVFAAGGCTGGPPGGGPSARPSAAAAGIADCGTVRVTLSEPPPEAGPRCLVDAAAAGRAARYVFTSPTVEGDPITRTYTSRPDGRVELVTDTRQDRFGPQRVTRHVCGAVSVKQGHLAISSCVRDG